MSGFVIGYGQPEFRNCARMLRKIYHRGSYLSGIREQKHAIMGQNYLKADILAEKDQIQVPVTSACHGDLSICYDGQIGNGEVLAQNNRLAEGPFLEERLLLYLYQQYGPRMVHYLNDAIFAFVISDGEKFFAARDLLGIKTLFYGWKENTLYLASELKSLVTVTDDVYEFPPGHYMESTDKLTCFKTLSEISPKIVHINENEIKKDIWDIIQRSVQHRVDFAEPTACLLSGGMDSSVIGYLANKLYKEKFGEDAQLTTFAVGIGESNDIQNACIMADHIDADHHELIVNRNQVLEILHEVIYYLESFDPSLVRSAASNFLISRYAKQHGIEVLLSGEGGDEVFCGYSYLKELSPQELPEQQIKCLGYLHNNAALRLDRMNQCHSIRVVAPLISGELLQYAMRIPPAYKVKTEGNQKIEKWIFRKAFEKHLPEAITWRTKQEFSQGSGSADFLPGYFENVVSDTEFAEAQAAFPMIRSKEELGYFRLFAKHFGTNRAVKTVGQWISL
jgi:asparagine synthase (glutamine-hydrolysing)